MKVKSITAYLESVAPLALQEEYDNSGLIIGSGEEEVLGALICLDCTEAVIDEAIQKKCNLIIAHHPIIFRGLKTITGKNYVERVVLKAIRNKISIYAIHTNLDNVAQGVNKMICNKLGLTNCKFLLPSSSGKGKYGAGMVGTLPTPMTEMAFLTKLKTVMKTDVIRHTTLLNKKVSKVTVCGGSGSFLLPNAMASGAGVFVTADIKYHQFFDADNKILIADIGHYESEVFTREIFFDFIKQNFPNFAVLLSEINTNPVTYS